MQVVKETEEQENLSPQDLRQWFQQEIADLSKALELRMKEASELVTAYNSGELSAQEAANRLRIYSRRWGEALPGTHTTPHISDAELLTAIDEAQHPEFTERLISKGRQARKSGSSGTSR